VVIHNLLTFQFNFDLPEVKLGTRFLNVRCRPVVDGALMTLLNINNLKEKEVHALNSLLEGQELERKRFAQEIHDGIGPLLSTLKMSLQGLQTSDCAVSNSEQQQEFARLIDLIDIITVDIRSISHSLLPAALVDFGLESALTNLCELVQRQSKTTVDCFVSQRNTRLEPGTELSLYRITQELLNNALKYAEAKTIAVQLIRHATTVVLMVEDDGVGFDSAALKKNMEGIGFKNVMSRVESLGGTFSLESAIGEGVLATVEVPLKMAIAPENGTKDNATSVSV
jgi:signal transduction histidine kinase